MNIHYIDPFEIDDPIFYDDDEPDESDYPEEGDFIHPDYDDTPTTIDELPF